MDVFNVCVCVAIVQNTHLMFSWLLTVSIFDSDRSNLKTVQKPGKHQVFQTSVA